MIKKDIEYNKTLEKNGVNFVDIELAYIERGAKIETGATIYPLVFIDKDSVVEKNAAIMSNVRITNSTIREDAKIEQSVVIDSEIGKGATVGPFAYVRPNSKVGAGCRIGDFVEIKNSNIGAGSKVSHLTYVGDSDIGEKVNLGCGVVFVNYDGKNKYRSTVGDGAFIGCNTNIISPVDIEKNSYVAAGSTVTKNVPEGSLYIERGKPKIIEGFAKRKLNMEEEK
jgi:bifunctional UDP-N-acetylglucosamine pyrophosphorylase/glucosamine-1-phosphate N-acetyltransferase